MAIGAYFHPKSMTTEQYRDVLKRLEAAGAGKPKGRSYHACFGESGDLMVFDVWDSQGDFDAFGQKLMPILSEVGIDVGTPQVMSVQNVIVG